jgi:hypothetical protein
MSDQTKRSSDASRALAERALKAEAIKSGDAKTRAVKSRTGKRARATPPPSHSIVTRSSAYVAPQQREAMIAESAYFRSAHRGLSRGTRSTTGLPPRRRSTLR